MCALQVRPNLTTKQFLNQDPFVEFSEQCSALDVEIDVFQAKVQLLPPNEKRVFHPELSQLTFSYMKLNRKANEIIYLSSIPGSKALVEKLQQKLDSVGKFICGEIPILHDDTLETVRNAAFAGILGGLGTLATQSLRSKITNLSSVPKTSSVPSPIPEIFDRVSVQHDVGTRGQFVIASTVYEKSGRSEQPARAVATILNKTKNPISPLLKENETTLQQYLDSRGLQLASRNDKVRIIRCDWDPDTGQAGGPEQNWEAENSRGSNNSSDGSFWSRDPRLKEAEGLRELAKFFEMGAGEYMDEACANGIQGRYNLDFNKYWNRLAGNIKVSL